MALTLYDVCCPTPAQPKFLLGPALALPLALSQASATTVHLALNPSLVLAIAPAIAPVLVIYLTLDPAPAPSLDHTPVPIPTIIKALVQALDPALP